MAQESTEIARGLRRRDPDLLDRLIEQYQHRLLRYLLYLTGRRELAEDLFQETWIRVLERGHQFNDKYAFSTWLFAVDSSSGSLSQLNSIVHDQTHARTRGKRRCVP